MAKFWHADITNWRLDQLVAHYVFNKNAHCAPTCIYMLPSPNTHLFSNKWNATIQFPFVLRVRNVLLLTTPIWDVINQLIRTTNASPFQILQWLAVQMVLMTFWEIPNLDQHQQPQQVQFCREISKRN